MSSFGNSYQQKEQNNLRIPNSQVVLVYTEWNADIVSQLREGALRVLSQISQITTLDLQVPGAVEIPFAIATHYRAHKASAYIALGCVIKGDTPHFEYVCQSVVQGITHLNVTQESPVIFGILTVLTKEQAYERLGGAHGHKGEEAAQTALDMLWLTHQIH